MRKNIIFVGFGFLFFVFLVFLVYLYLVEDESESEYVPTNFEEEILLNSNVKKEAMSSASLTSPSPKVGVVQSGNILFEWVRGGEENKYKLIVESEEGGTICAYEGQDLEFVCDLNYHGKSVFVTLSSFFPDNNIWRDRVYTFSINNKTQNISPVDLTYPENGSTFNSTSIKFEWERGIGVDEYNVYVGSALGESDIFYGDGTLKNFLEVSDLPDDGRRVYVRLWSLINSNWEYNDYQFVAFKRNVNPNYGIFTTPEDGSVVNPTKIDFSWKAPINVKTFYVTIGTKERWFDIFVSEELNNLKDLTVTNLPINSEVDRIYVSLWSRSDGEWVVNDFSYSVGK